MRYVIAALLTILGCAVDMRGMQRCPGVPQKSLTVDSAQAFSLPAVSVANASDYQVAEASDWIVVPNNETWVVRGTVLADTIHAGSVPPSVQRRLFNPSSLPSYVYFVVFATSSSTSFVPCAQDFLVTVNADPALRSDAARMIVPVAGSLHGANNSVFRTRLLLDNRYDTAVTGKIIFHPSGFAPPATDPPVPNPSLSYSIPAKSAVNYDDVVVSLQTTGLGSIDVVPDRTSFGYLVPASRVQIVSVAGAGSYQTDVPVVTFDGAYGGSLWTSGGAARFLLDTTGTKRLAVGIRTLADPVAVTASLVDVGGTVLSTVVRTYPGEYHEQQPLSSWFAAAPAPGQSLEISAARTNKQLPGGAVIYLAETDNSTNDVTVLVAKPDTLTLGTPVISCSPLCTALR